MPEPRALPLVLDLWRAHRDNPVVMQVRCAKPCGKLLGEGRLTPRGVLLHYRQHVAPVRRQVDASALTPERQQEWAALRRVAAWEPGADEAITNGLFDGTGWLAVAGGDPALWHPVQVGCAKHDGLAAIDPQDVLEAGLEGARTGRVPRLSVSRRT